MLAPMGLRLSEEKTRVAHIDEGFDFLGWRIQRHQKRGGIKRYVYTYPAKKALASIVDKVRTITRQGTNLPLSTLLHRLNPVLRGWTNYFRPGVSSKTFSYLQPLHLATGHQMAAPQAPPGSTGNSSDGDASHTGGGRRRGQRRCSTPARCRPLDTATGEQ